MQTIKSVSYFFLFEDVRACSFCMEHGNYHVSVPNPIGSVHTVTDSWVQDPEPSRDHE
jgi:hypothetical protein